MTGLGFLGYYIRKLHLHQLSCDMRIRNQREQIKRLEAELTRERDTARIHYEWRKESEDWKDPKSAWWQIHNLRSQNALLKQRLFAAEKFLKGEASDDSIRAQGGRI